MGQPVKYRAELRLPAQGATETEALLVQWNVAVGDEFAVGDRLAQAESEKSVFDFEAPCRGRVAQLYYQTYDSVPLDQPIMAIETDDVAVRPWAATLVPINAESTDIAGSVEEAAEETSGETATEVAVNTANTDNIVVAKDAVNAADVTNMVATTNVVAAANRADASSVVFLGFGSDLPERIVENAELLGPFPEVDSDYIYKVTGVRRRHWASEEERPSDLALRAAQRAIADAQIETSQIDAVIVATVTPDVAMPSTACILTSKLGLSGIPAFDLNAACSGWLYAVGVARGLVATGVARCVLTVGVDLQSRLLDRNDRSTVFLFGDGAGAAIIASESYNERASCSPRLRWLELACEPQGLTWARRTYPGDRVSGLDHGSQGVDPWIRMDGTEIFRIASRAMAESIREALRSTGWSAQSITKVIPHQANARILRVIERHISLSSGVLHVGLEETGNIASGSIPVSLCGLKDQFGRGDRLIFCAAGAGITVAAAAVEWYTPSS